MMPLYFRVYEVKRALRLHELLLLLLKVRKLNSSAYYGMVWPGALRVFGNDRHRVKLVCRHDHKFNLNPRFGLNLWK